MEILEEMGLNHHLIMAAEEEVQENQVIMDRIQQNLLRVEMEDNIHNLLDH